MLYNSEDEEFHDKFVQDYVTDGMVLGLFSKDDDDDANDARNWKNQGDDDGQDSRPRSKMNPRQEHEAYCRKMEEYAREHPQPSYNPKTPEELAQHQAEIKRIDEEWAAKQKKREEEARRKAVEKERLAEEHLCQDREEYRTAIAEHRYIDAARMKKSYVLPDVLTTSAALRGVEDDYNDVRRRMAENFVNWFEWLF